MRKLTKRKRSALRYILSFLIPSLIVVGVMVYLGITPFGDHTVFKWDAKLQHKDYYGYLWDVLHGNASIQYSSGKSLGGRMLGLIGFYISSPLNFLLFFFKKSQIPLFMAIMIILRIGLCGITSQYYISKRYQTSRYSSLLFSTAYALMEYNVSYCANVMWLDGVIFLPLIAIGVHDVISEKKRSMLYFSVALSILSNWYTGYMVCLMSGFYFIYEYIIYCNFQPILRLRKEWALIKMYVSTMLLGVATSAVMLLPACMALIGGKATYNQATLTGNVHFDFLHFFSGFELNATVNNQSSPVIFCGGLLLICTFYFFFSSSICREERVLTGALVFLLISSFCFQDLELLWTAYIRSTSYYFRFSFVVPFVMLMIGGRVWSTIRETGIQRRALFFSLALIFLIFGFLYLRGDLNSSKKVLILYCAMLVLIGICMALSTCNKVQIRRLSIICLAGIVTVELSYNTYMPFRDYKESASLFSDYVQDMESLLSALDQQAGNQFYRFEKNVSYLTLTNKEVATCESLLFHYNSIEHYSSAYDEMVDAFLSAVGYSDLTSKTVFRCETYWNSPMLVTDSLLSVRYVLLPESTYGYKQIDLDVRDTLDGVQIYENETALPLAYNVATNMEDVSYGDNPYENQNNLISSMIGEPLNVYSEVPVDYQGLQEQNETYLLHVQSDGPVYLYVDGGAVHGNFYNDNCEVYVNGQLLQKTCQRFLINSMLLGDYKAGDTVEVQIHHNNDDLKQHQVYLAQLDIEQFEYAINLLELGYQCNLQYDGNVVQGTYTTDHDSCVFLSIPYETAWTAYVDGEEVSYEELAGTFIGIDLSAGTHEIKLVYHTPGLTSGLLISVTGIALFCCVQVLTYKRKHVM